MRYHLQQNDEGELVIEDSHAPAEGRSSILRTVTPQEAQAVLDSLNEESK